MLIQLGAHHFRYAIIDSRNYNVLVLYDRSLWETTDTEKALNSIFVEEDILQETFNRVDISLWSQYFTLTPADLWQEGNENALMQLVFGEATDNCQSVHLFDEQLVAVYSLHDNWQRWFQEHFPKASIHHSAIPLLNHYRRLNASNGKSKVYAHFQKEALEVAVIKDGALSYYNHFRYRSKEDVAYFLLLVYDQLPLDRHEVPLILAGGIVQDSAVYQLLYRYLSEIQFARLPEKIVMEDGAFGEISRHDFVNLLSMAQ